MSVELDDSYQSIYQHAVSQMALGNPDQAIASLWRILNRLNAEGGFRGRVRNVESVGQSSADLAARWDEEHPDDPVV